VDISDRPSVYEYSRVHTPSVITENDIDDLALRMETLEFNITTLVSSSSLGVTVTVSDGVLFVHGFSRYMYLD
jgi:hypothetical protein